MTFTTDKKIEIQWINFYLGSKPISSYYNLNFFTYHFSRYGNKLRLSIQISDIKKILSMDNRIQQSDSFGVEFSDGNKIISKEVNKFYKDGFVIYRFENVKNIPKVVSFFQRLYNKFKSL